MSTENPRGKGSADESNGSEDKEFSCDYCDTQLTSQASKRRHERNFHSDKLEYECPTCDDAFHTLTGRNGHHTTVHGESIAGEETTCKYCNSTYRVSRCELDGSNFCSKDCLYDWRSENHVGENNPQYQRETVECSNCGGELERHPYQVEQFEQLFCDMNCKAEWQSTNVVGENHHRWKDNTDIFTCEYCGDEYENESRQEGRTRFCTQDCLTSWQSENLSRENSVHWKGGYGEYYGPNWRSQRRKARIRDQSRCQSCGITPLETGEEMDVHHIQPIRKYKQNYDEPKWYLRGNQLDNLVCLCRSCHQKWEGIPLRPQ